MVKYRITHILWTLGRGGAERMVLDLLKELRARGHDAGLIAAGGGGPMLADALLAGIPVRVAPEGGRRALIRFLHRELTERRPDILHTHLGGDIWAGLVGKVQGIHPWVMTAHSHEPDVPWLQRLGRHWAYRSADHVACVSNGVRDAVHQRYRVSAERSSIIPVGLDLSRFHVREARLPSDVPSLLTVGRLVPEKNHAMLLRALALVRRPWTLELVGVGTERLALRRLAETLGILPRVRFAGEVADPATKLASADLFLFPSLHEGQGLALFEAAASRLPAIASDLNSLRESFSDRAVRFVSPSDPEAWAVAIRETLERYGEALTRAEEARRVVVENYSVDRMTSAYEGLYRKLHTPTHS